MHPTSRQFTQMAAWLEANADVLLDNPDNNLIGLGIGKKSDGPLDDESPFCITGFVEEKLSRRQIASRGIESFAQAAALASDHRNQALDFEINVVETGSRFQAQPGLTVPAAQRGVFGGLPPILDLQKRFQVLRSGVGITNPHRTYPTSLSVGTLGFFVRDDKGRIYLVSNNHVIADENNARKNDAVVQPGSLDLTSSELSLMNPLTKLSNNLKIAELSAWVDILFWTSNSNIPVNSVDCAAAELTNSGRDLSEIARIGLGGRLMGQAAPPTVDPLTGQIVGSTRVYKAGRTTGWTEGDISQLAVVTDVHYATGPARFRNQIGITASADNAGPFSAKGDSGSGIVDGDQQLVGLLFAGTPIRTLANPIQAVLDELAKALKVHSLDVVT